MLKIHRHLESWWPHVLGAKRLAIGTPLLIRNGGKVPVLMEEPPGKSGYSFGNHRPIISSAITNVRRSTRRRVITNLIRFTKYAESASLIIDKTLLGDAFIERREVLFTAGCLFAFPASQIYK